MVDFESWPVLPQDLRPKVLYHCSAMSPDLEQALVEAGWQPKDIRTLPETTEEEKVGAIKAYLQGIRLGSIMPPRGGIHFAELEAKVFGLLLTKRPEKAKEPMNEEDLEGVLGPLVNWKAKNKGK